MRRIAHVFRLADQFRENVVTALDSLAAAKGRSGLTVLGVVIGVSTVMAMATIVSGVRDQIVEHDRDRRTDDVLRHEGVVADAGESAGRAGVDSQPSRSHDRRRAIASRSCPRVKYASIWGQIQNETEYAGEHTNIGVDHGRRRGLSRDLRRRARRRPVVHAMPKQVSGASVVVLSSRRRARSCSATFSRSTSWVRIGGRPIRVIGIYQEAANIFQPPGQAVHGIMPYRTMDRQFTIDKTNALFIPVKPRAGRHRGRRAGSRDDRAARSRGDCGRRITTAST